MKNNFYRGIIFVSTISIIVLAVLTYVPLSSSLKLSFDSITNTVDVSMMGAFVPRIFYHCSMNRVLSSKGA